MCITGDTVEGVSVAAVTVSVVTVTVTVPMVTVAGFEWPVPTHCPIFSLCDLKSKPGMEGCALRQLRGKSPG